MPAFTGARSSSRVPDSSPTSFKRPKLFTTSSSLGQRLATIPSRPTFSVSSSFRSTKRAISAEMPAPILPNYLQHQERDENDDSRDHIILAIDRSGTNKTGCAYYVAREGLLACMDDILHAEDNTIDTLKLDIQPTVVLLSHRIEISELELAGSNSVDLGDDDDPVLPYKVELRPAAEFNYEQALQKLVNIPSLRYPTRLAFLVPGERDDTGPRFEPTDSDWTNERGKSLYISCCVNLEDRVSIGCAGALITYLWRKKQSEYLQGDPAADEAYQILRLETFSLKDTMLVNSAALHALQILQPESHPSAANQGPRMSNSKKPPSIYGLFCLYAKTPQGRQCLRALFMHPSTDLDIIKQRHDAVAVLAKLENLDCSERLSKSLTKIKNLRRVMVMLHKGIEAGTKNRRSIKSSVWSTLQDFCFHVIDIAETLQQMPGVTALPLYQRLHASLNRVQFQRIGKLIYDVVDVKESRDQQRTVIKRGVNEHLDNIKNTYNRMDDILHHAAMKTILELPQSLSTPPLTVVYLPQFGYHIHVPVESANEYVDNGLLNADWERMFRTQTAAYFKNKTMRRMDDDLGDVWASVCGMEIELSHDLAQRVLGHEAFLVNASDVCGELDATLAMAHGAVQYQLSRPRMVEENIIDIEAGRHLIQELAVPAYVANDVFAVGGQGAIDVDGDPADNAVQHPTMLLLTGPNHSGKSVYLKQAALIVYMAQVGSFVPAVRATLGITDKILTRITTRETVSKGQSSFMIDLQQVSRALKSFTPQSLLVMDEFGKGTDNCDGAGLAAGVLQYLLSLGPCAPKVLASTHFHEIFEQGLLAENIPGLGLRQMEVRVSHRGTARQGTGNHNIEVTYLYNVRPGRSQLSYGALCTAMNGIPVQIVERACQLSGLSMAGEDVVAACAGVTADELPVLEEAEAVSRAVLALDLESLAVDQVSELKNILSELVARNSRYRNVSPARASKRGRTSSAASW